MRLSYRLLALLGSLALGALSLGQVTVHTLLGEMVDLNHLAERPSPAYTMALASSYNRASVTPGTDSWFANNDKGYYVRTEVNSSRTEYVMADLKGPGAVVRMWCANPYGTMRFYFDGETTPRITATMTSLLSGLTAPYNDPFGYVASEGHNLYFPFPYAKSLKITVQATSGQAASVYYQIGYRTYASGTNVTTFVPGSATTAELSGIANTLNNPSLRPTPALDDPVSTSGSVSQIAPAILNLVGPEAVYQFSVKVDPPTVQSNTWTDPNQMQNVLRNLILDVRFDGELCIEAPLGDFFGTAPGINPYGGYPFSVDPDGTMTCRFVMPYATGASFMVRNLSSTVNPNITLTATTGPFNFDSGSYYLHSQWIADQQPTRPFRDINLLTAQGEGLWVGDNLHVSNPVQPWWGEGDEKVYVDADSFPSTFGTGSEDYYGYAYCCPDLFARPYHGQSRFDPHAGYGNEDMHRWHVIDPIPYTQGLSFNMEANSLSTTGSPYYAHTVYWYARPGGQPLTPLNTALLPPPATVLPSSLAGNIQEAETANVATVTRGALTVLTHQLGSLNYRMLQWHGGVTGDKLIFNVNIPVAGKYRWSFRPQRASNKAIVRILVNNTSMGTWDLYYSGTSLSQSTLTPDINLPAGNSTFEFDITGRNASSTGYDVILDYFIFRKL